MNLLRFMEQFPDEDSCRSHLRETRGGEGVVRKKCRCKKHYCPKAKQGSLQVHIAMGKQS